MKKLFLAAMATVLLGLTNGFATNPYLADTIAVDTVKNWTFGGFTSLQLNQVALVNWNAGGENSFSATALGQVFANYKKGKWAWENRLDLGYGTLYSKTFGWQKNEDKIDLLSKAKRSIGQSKFSYTGEMNFKTQFAPGYTLPDDSTIISRFMAPGYLLLSVGIDYKPADWISFYFSPATGKFTFVTDQSLADQGSFGVEAAVYDTAGVRTTKGANFRAEFGAYFSMSIKKDIMKNISLATDVNLFNNYTDKDKENRKKVDVDWQTSINMKVNKFITVSLFTHLIYDFNIKQKVFDKNDNAVYQVDENGIFVLNTDGEKVQKNDALIQFKEVLGVGFSYKF
tara:strand:+ start:109 stop:1131 length:1023 start_codon:yes stop_codon:yes gene_type:complete